MNKLVQAIIGVVIGVAGFLIMGAACATIILAKAVTMWAVVFLCVGAGLLFWGGAMVPNSGVEDGAHKLTVFVSPWLDYLPGGRRRTDPPAPRIDPNPPGSTE